MPLELIGCVRVRSALLCLVITLVVGVVMVVVVVVVVWLLSGEVCTGHIITHTGAKTHNNELQ